MKQVAGSIKLELAQYREMAAFAQFASDLDVATQKLLNRGSRLTELLKQSQYSPMPVEDQVISIFAGVKGYLDELPVHDVSRFEQAALGAIHHEQPKLVESIRKEKALSEKTEENLHAFFKNLVKIFT